MAGVDIAVGGWGGGGSVATSSSNTPVTLSLGSLALTVSDAQGNLLLKGTATPRASQAARAMTGNKRSPQHVHPAAAFHPTAHGAGGARTHR